MKKVGLKPKKIACFTDKQQEYYESLNARQRKYVDFRGQGYSKTQSYKMAGYGGKNVTQAAFNLEKHDKGIAELVQTMLMVKQAKDVIIGDENSRINQTIDALAMQESAEKIIEKVEGSSSEDVRRIQFYRDIISGKIKSVKKITHRNAEGAVTKVVLEETSDIDVRMKARKELDKILGLNSVLDIGQLQMGDITINIVDASKKEELEDDRNKVILDPDNVQILDGEQTLVTEKEVVSRANDETSGKDKFFEVMEDE